MIKFALLVLCAYFLLCLLVYLFQEKMAFYPERLPPDYKYEYDADFIEENFTPAKEVLINALLFQSKEKSPRGLIYYLHGNAGSLRSWGGVAEDLLPYGYDVLIIDYRGYGKSRGRMSEQGLYADAQFIYEQMGQRYAEKKIVIYGRSIGSGVAARLAMDNRPGMLILEAPFYSMRDLARHHYPFLPAFILRYHLPVYKFLPETQCPVHIFHGTDDNVVPYESGLRLKELLKSKGSFTTVENGGHNDLSNYQVYKDRLSEILIDKR